MQRRRAWIVTFAWLVLASSVTGCLHAPVPTADRMQADVAQLETAFPTLSGLQVSGFRNQDWCRFIDYQRGTFTNVLEETSTCNLFDGVPAAFDDKATQDFATVRQALADTGVTVMMVFVRMDRAGAVEAATFDLVAGDFDRFSYVYDRSGATLPEPNPDTIVAEQINDNWLFFSEDWN